MGRRKRKAWSCGRDDISFFDLMVATYPFRADLVVFYLRDGRYDELDEALERADRRAAPMVRAYTKICNAPGGSAERIRKVKAMRQRLRAEMAVCYELAKVDPTYTGPTTIDFRVS